MKNVLQWPTRPSKTQHRILGLRLRWTDKASATGSKNFPKMAIPFSLSFPLMASGSSAVAED